ncbi:hypothetical protein [Natrinema sp. 1APR25-10V2]|uniref:hypothetical protein n=1 Tax=Natrinema sp. 1APR25-10V2 TaxID=2951081 RepID=UPI0028748159|nr:hypothetical protein [Natrinema sp. 1APR25-10V2]MDS0476821.1 hypothetical protein [Natrinema sp. 1APR25-10V2]
MADEPGHRAALNPIQHLAREYAEARRNGTERRYVRQPRDGALQYATFSYVPVHHFQQAYDTIVADQAFEPDGGYETQYAEPNWTPDSHKSAHEAVHSDVCDVLHLFFPEEDTVWDYLETRDDTGNPDRYQGRELSMAATWAVDNADPPDYRRQRGPDHTQVMEAIEYTQAEQSRSRDTDESASTARTECSDGGDGR